MTRAVSSPRRSSARSTATSRPKPVVSKDYWTQSQLPLTSLCFLLLPMAIYELGTRTLTRQEIIAFRLLQDFFNLLGATGPHLPALAVIGILLAQHIARNDRWNVNLRTIGKMAIESLVLAVPVIVLGLLAARVLPHLPLAGQETMAVGTSRKIPLIILSFGAGIYEELVFRLILFTILNMIIVDAVKVRKPLSSILIVAVPAILFSFYHYLGAEHFTLHSFVFRTLAGLYFGLVFLYRGFGITAGSHAAYDILIVTLT